MELKLIREQYEKSYTQGKLYIDNKLFCSTLEPSRELLKHPCIPVGHYKVTMRYSPKLKAQRPWLHNVAGREFILMHEGNHAKDSKGCILVGMAAPKLSGTLQFSMVTIKRLVKEITSATKHHEEVWITIE